MTNRKNLVFVNKVFGPSSLYSGSGVYTIERFSNFVFNGLNELLYPKTSLVYDTCLVVVLWCGSNSKTKFSLWYFRVVVTQRRSFPEH